MQQQQAQYPMQFSGPQIGHGGGFIPSQMGIQQQPQPVNPYGPMPAEYPPNLTPEVMQQLKSLGENERPYYEKVCQLRQFIGFLEGSMGKYRSDPAMVKLKNVL